LDPRVGLKKTRPLFGGQREKIFRKASHGKKSGPRVPFLTAVGLSFAFAGPTRPGGVFSFWDPPEFCLYSVRGPFGPAPTLLNARGGFPRRGKKLLSIAREFSDYSFGLDFPILTIFSIGRFGTIFSTGHFSASFWFCFRALSAPEVFRPSVGRQLSRPQRENGWKAGFRAKVERARIFSRRADWFPRSADSRRRITEPPTVFPKNRFVPAKGRAGAPMDRLSPAKLGRTDLSSHEFLARAGAVGDGNLSKKLRGGGLWKVPAPAGAKWLFPSEFWRRVFKTFDQRGRGNRSDRSPISRRFPVGFPGQAKNDID